jgi:type VI protein secretion system component VasK
VREWAERHPNLTTWAVLAVGMVVVLAWSAREVALSPSQWTWLALATVGLAGLCAWIISWEADRPDEYDDLGEAEREREPDGAEAAAGTDGAPAASSGAGSEPPEAVADSRSGGTEGAQHG